MGKFETISTGQVMPSQDYLKLNTLEFILDCIANNNFTNMPPAPIVRKDPDSDLYIAIDGHNLIAVYDFIHKDIEVYVAESAHDVMEGTALSIKVRNKDLSEKYESALIETASLKKQGLTSFTTLRNKYLIIADAQNNK